MSKFLKLGIPAVALSLISGFFVSVEISPAEASQADGTLSDLQLRGAQLLDITEDITFTAVLRCELGITTDPDGPIGTLELGTFGSNQWLSVTTEGVLAPDSGEYVFTWTITPFESYVLQEADQVPVQAFSNGCASQTTLSSHILDFDGPYTAIVPDAAFRKKDALSEPFGFSVFTFEGGLPIRRTGDRVFEIFSALPVCGPARFDDADQIFVRLTESEISAVSPGPLFVLCEGGTLAPAQQHRRDSIVEIHNHLTILHDLQVPLAPSHFFDLHDGPPSRLGPFVDGVIPVGQADAVYVYAHRIQSQDEIRQKSLGALVNRGAQSVSLSEENCSLLGNYQIASSTTDRLVVMTGNDSSRGPSILKMTFDEENVTCELAYIYEEGFGANLTEAEAIKSIALLDSQTVVTLNADFLTLFDIGQSPSNGTWAFVNQFDTSTLGLTGIATDGNGGLWALGVVGSSLRIYKIIFPDGYETGLSQSMNDDTGDLNDSNPEPLETELTYSFAKPPGTFLSRLEIRSDILTVSSINEWGALTSLRSLKLEDDGSVQLVATLDHDATEECEEEIYADTPVLCSASLMGVDETNGVVFMSAMGPTLFFAPLDSESQSVIFDEGSEINGALGRFGSISNNNDIVWLADFNSVFGLQVLRSSPASFPPNVPTEPDLAPVPPSQNEVSSQPAPRTFGPIDASASGPTLDALQPKGVIGSELLLTGQKLSSVTSIRIGGVLQVITSKTERSIRFTVAPETKLGSNDIVLVSSFGTITLQSAIQIESPSTSVASATKSALIGKTRLLSKNAAVNQSWFAANLKDSGITRIACTVLVSPNATHHQRVQARKQASRVCAQAATHLVSASVWFQTRETIRSRMPGRALITFRG